MPPPQPCAYATRLRWKINNSRNLGMQSRQGSWFFEGTWWKPKFPIGFSLGVRGKFAIRIDLFVFVLNLMYNWAHLEYVGGMLQIERYSIVSTAELMKTLGDHLPYWELSCTQGRGLDVSRTWLRPWMRSPHHQVVPRSKKRYLFWFTLSESPLKSSRSDYIRHSISFIQEDVMIVSSAGRWYRGSDILRYLAQHWVVVVRLEVCAAHNGAKRQHNKKKKKQNWQIISDSAKVLGSQLFHWHLVKREEERKLL